MRGDRVEPHAEAHPGRLRPAVLLVFGVLGLGGCTAGAAPATTLAPTGSGAGAAPETVRSRSQDAQAMLDALPACPTAPRAGEAGDLPDLVVVPPGTIVTRRHDTAPLIEIEAWVPTDPVSIRRFYENLDREGQTGTLELQQIEDETVESEVLLVGSGGRFYAKALARCPTESTLFLVVSPSG